jgi:hypothetical protein
LQLETWNATAPAAISQSVVRFRKWLELRLDGLPRRWCGFLFDFIAGVILSLAY